MKNQNVDWGVVGCLGMVFLFCLPYILITTFQALVPYLFLGAIGLIVYRLHLYDQETGKLTYEFEKFFGLLDKPKENIIELKNEPQKTFPKKVLKTLTRLGKKIERVERIQKDERLNQERERKAQEIKFQNTLKQHTSEVKMQTKKEYLNNLLEGADTIEYSKSDVFEREANENRNRKKEEELKLRELEIKVTEKIQNQDKVINQVKMEGVLGRNDIILKMQTGFLKIEGEFMNFKQYVGEKFNQLDIRLANELNSMYNLIKDVERELKEENSELRLTFGKEILRLDSQQIKIVGKVENYVNKVNGFAADIERVKLESERNSWNAQKILSMAEMVNKEHRLEIEKASLKLDRGLEKMSLNNHEFANTVGTAKLRLDVISQEQFLALKDIAIEKKGIGAMRDAQESRAKAEQSNMEKLIERKKHLESKMADRDSNNQKIMRLQHRINMTNEQVKHQSNMDAMMRHENALLNR